MRYLKTNIIVVSVHSFSFLFRSSDIDKSHGMPEFPVGSFTVRATRCVEQPPVLAAVGLL